MGDADAIYRAVEPLLMNGTDKDAVLLAIREALRCHMCGQPRQAVCARCRGRLGGLRSSSRKSTRVRQNLKTAHAVRSRLKEVVA